MGKLIGIVVTILCIATPAFAAGSGIAQGTSFLLILFLGFAAVIIVFQFIPGLVLLFTMLKGLFKAAPKDAHAEKK